MATATESALVAFHRSSLSEQKRAAVKVPIYRCVVLSFRHSSEIVRVNNEMFFAEVTLNRRRISQQRLIIEGPSSVVFGYPEHDRCTVAVGLLKQTALIFYSPELRLLFPVELSGGKDTTEFSRRLHRHILVVSYLRTPITSPDQRDPK